MQRGANLRANEQKPYARHEGHSDLTWAFLLLVCLCGQDLPWQVLGGFTAFRRNGQRLVGAGLSSRLMATCSLLARFLPGPTWAHRQGLHSNRISRSSSLLCPVLTSAERSVRL